jgi:NNP family nitrate/nitrite transporter-like MFS transporter
LLRNAPGAGNLSIEGALEIEVEVEGGWMPGPTTEPTGARPGRALGASTIAFTACFAAWTIFSIIGLEPKDRLRLSEAEFGLLLGMPILSGSIARVPLGVWAQRFGGRRVFAAAMALAAPAVYLVSLAESYAQLLLGGFAMGIAGGAFAAGIAYVSRLYPPERQGAALGVFGTSNAGAAVTTLVAPLVMAAMGWRAVAQVWAAALLVPAMLFLIATREDSETAARLRGAREPVPVKQQLEVLRNLQVWRFSLYYFFVFGAFVAIALWLPRYLMGAYGLDLAAAGALAAVYIVPASVFRRYGGKLADRYGARAVMYAVLGIGVPCTFMLAYPPTTYIVEGARGPITFRTEMGLAPFLVTIALLGFVMGLGKAAVFKHIPDYYPNHVGAVGGAVGMIGGLGGFILPVAFGALLDLTDIWTSCFALLFLLVLVALAWMHLAIRRMERSAGSGGPAEALPELPEMQGLGEPGAAPPRRAGAIADWQPENPEFWAHEGRPVARRNLWISTYCLMLSFAVWMVWSVVVARLPGIGFDFTTDQLFWLAALPGLSGATLRIFYAFLVPIFGGRLWTTLSTASLLIPAFGIGYAVQDPGTPYLIFLVLALLCGFGGGNFASSVANISFFFPKAEKGNALAINSGLGNLGVSLMQFLVPVVVTASLFGALGGQAQALGDGTRVWLQNAGFVWIPPIMIGALAAWFGMNDILSARSSFADQAAIFGRRHTWLMCWLYTGTFGTFIGMSAGFPLLANLVFPEADALRHAFIGPLLGALSRAGSGWIADRLGGARVTFWVFVLQMAATTGMLWSLGAHSFPAFFAMVLLLFLVSGVGNASTFQMVPAIMRAEVDRTSPARDPEARRLQADRESAAVIGFISAIAAYGAFYIPKAYGSSIELGGSAEAALWSFFAFYLSCAALTWAAYGGPRAADRQPAPGSPASSALAA